MYLTSGRICARGAGKRRVYGVYGYSLVIYTPVLSWLPELREVKIKGVVYGILYVLVCR